MKRILKFHADFIGNDTRVKDIIENLEIRFDKLDASKTSKEIIDLIYDGYYYEFNSEILKVLIDEIGELDAASFDTSNYYSIKTSSCEGLFEHVKVHINDYIQDVYLSITTNINEIEESYIELLGNEELSVKNIEKIVERTVTKINDVSLFEDASIAGILLKYSNVVPTWENIIFYYESNEAQISDTLLQFLNQESNYKELSKHKIPTDDKEKEENRYRPFILNLIKLTGLDNDSYDHILKSIPYIYSSLSFEGLPYEKVKLLLMNHILVLSPDNYNGLKENYDDLHIRLLIDKKSKLIISIADYEIDQDDLFKLISSNELDLNEKNTIIDNLDETVVLSNSSTIAKIGDLIIESPSFSISNLILKKVLLINNISKNYRIKIFALKQSQLDSDLITDFLNSLDEPFSEITITGKKPLLEYNIENLKLAEILKTEDYISNFKIEEDKGIRIYTFRKQSE